MPHELRIQRRGRGGSIWKATHRAKAKVRYPMLPKDGSTLKGEVSQIFTDPIRSGILARITMADGAQEHIVAPEGIAVGQTITFGPDAPASIGNVLPLEKISEGCPVFNIELIPGDGGKLVRASGMYGLLMSKDGGKAIVKMPSGKTKTLSARSRATIGLAACGGRNEKPFVKAGSKYHAMRAKQRPWPIVRGVAMNAVSHPFGGGQHHAGKSKSTSRNAPPGRKVGAIASKRTGRKKKN